MCAVGAGPGPAALACLLQEAADIRRGLISSPARSQTQPRQLQVDNDFFGLLSEVASPPVGPASSWPVVKPQLWRDPRYQALPEERRRELFNEYTAGLQQEAEAAAALGGAAFSGTAVAKAGGSPVGGGGSGGPAFLWDDSLLTAEEEGLDPQELAQLQLLRWVGPARAVAGWLCMPVDWRGKWFWLCKHHPFPRHTSTTHYA